MSSVLKKHDVSENTQLQPQTDPQVAATNITPAQRHHTPLTRGELDLTVCPFPSPPVLVAGRSPLGLTTLQWGFP